MNFELKDNLITSIISPNGSGKTTLLSIISNLTIPDSGYVKFTNDDSFLDIFLILAGDRNLYPKNSVKENIFYFARLRNIEKDTINYMIKKYRDLISIYNDVENKLIEELSFGQKKIISVLIALVINPKYIILDEITEGIDVDNKKIILELLINQKKHSSVLISSHDIEFVKNISDESFSIDDKKLIRLC